MKTKGKSRSSKIQEYAWARRHGLKPFGKFKQSLSGSLDRIPADQRESILNTIYALAARRVRFKDEKQMEQGLPERVRPDRLKMVQMRAHLKNSVNELTVANNMFPKEPLPWPDFEGIINFLKEQIENIKTWEGALAVLIDPQLRTPEESASARSFIATTEQFPMGLTKKDSRIDFAFIAAVERSLPNVAARGGQIDAERTEIISKVFDAAFGESEYSFHTIKSIRSRLQKKPLENNPYLTNDSKELTIQMRRRKRNDTHTSPSWELLVRERQIQR